MGPDQSPKFRILNWRQICFFLHGSAPDETLVYLGSGVSQHNSWDHEKEWMHVGLVCTIHRLFKQLSLGILHSPSPPKRWILLGDFWVQEQLIQCTPEPDEYLKVWLVLVLASGTRALLCTLSLIRLLKTRQRGSVLDESVDVVLGSMLWGGDLKHVGDA